MMEHSSFTPLKFVNELVKLEKYHHFQYCTSRHLLFVDIRRGEWPGIAKKPRNQNRGVGEVLGYGSSLKVDPH